MTQRINRSILAALLIGFFVLAGCNLETPDPDGFAWCYSYDLTADDYGFSFIYGSYVEGVGFVADDQYRLVGGLVEDFSVYPVTVSATLVRLLPEPPPDPIPTLNIQGVAQIFGLEIDAAAGGTLPEGIDTITLSQSRQYASDHGEIINATIQGSAPYALTEIWIGGEGPSPYDVNPCDVSTSTPTLTPFLATDAPTSTIAPTYTPSPTPTWSPSPTPTATTAPTCPTDWTPVAGGRYQTYAFFDGCEPLVTEVSLYTGGGNTTINSSDSNTSPNSLLGNLNGSQGSIGVRFEIPVGWQVYGVGVYAKRIGGTTSALQVQYANSAGTVINNNTISTGIATSWTGYSSFPFGGPGNNTIRYIHVTAQVNGSGMPRLDTITITLAAYPSGFETWTPTPSSTNTPTPTTTATIPTGTSTPPAVTAIASGTPSATATASATRFPIGVYTAPPLGTFPPPVTPWATGTVNFQQTMTAMFGGTGTPQATGTYVVIPWDPEIPEGLGEGGGLDGVGEGIAEMGRGILSFGYNAMNTALGFGTTLGNTVGGVITAWKDAQPQPIEGLPNCTGAARLQSELCAIYYILTYTIFAGTLGSILIPVATIVIGMVIIFVVIKRIRAIAARIGEINKT